VDVLFTNYLVEMTANRQAHGLSDTGERQLSILLQQKCISAEHKRAQPNVAYGQLSLFIAFIKVSE